MDEEIKVEVNFTLSYDDTIKVFYENYFSNVLNIISMSAAGIGLLLSIALAVLMLIVKEEGTYPEILFYVTGAIFLIFLLRPLIYIPRVQAIWKTKMKIPKEYVWEFTSDQLVYTSKFGQLIYNWDIFYRISEQKNFFSFFVSLAEYYVIPKRVLTEDQIKNLRALIKLSANPQLVKVKIRS